MCSREHGVKKGDRVTIYLPMIPEAAYRDARLRAHRRDSFGGLRRLLAGFARRPHRGLRSRRSSSPPTKACAAASKIPLKANVDEALDKVSASRRCIVVTRTGAEIDMQPGRDFRYEEEAATRHADCPYAERWTRKIRCSFSTRPARPASPRASLHTTGGYLVYAALTHEHVFDYRDGDVYWCTADVGWVTATAISSTVRWPMARRR